MLKQRLPLLTVSWLLLTCASASAQEKGQTGLTMAFPTSVGLIWHVSDRVALRPDGTFSWSSSAANPAAVSPLPSITSSASGSSYGVGLSGLFYVGKWDSLSAYLSPRFSYARTTTTVTTTISGLVLDGLDGAILNPRVPSSVVSENTNSVYSVSGSFGAQYSFSRKFGVFGEAGLGYSDSSPSSTGSSIGSTIHTLSTRAGVGVLFYF